MIHHMRIAAALLLLLAFSFAPVQAQSSAPQLIAPGVWFFLGDSHKGYSNTVVIEMADYLIVVDANYPGRARELIAEMPKLSPKPVRYVFDTHAHGDHSYGNSLWTAAGATTIAYSGVLKDMDRYEPLRWQAAVKGREDVRSLHQDNVEQPKQTFTKSPFILQDSTREVDFEYLGWGHTPGDGYVWLPKERILCTGDAAVNGPRNRLGDANLANWPRALDKALRLKPVHVLPGHGDAGGPGILVGQRHFLLDLYQAVAKQAHEGKTPEQMNIQLPSRDENWIPKDLLRDVKVVYAEVTQHQPAGALPHDFQ